MYNTDPLPQPYKNPLKEKYRKKTDRKQKPIIIIDGLEGIFIPGQFSMQM